MVGPHRRRLGRGGWDYGPNGPSAANGAAAPEITSLSEGAAAIQLTIRLPLESSYVINQLSPIMTPGQLAGALAAWLTLLSSGAILLMIHKAVVEYKMPAAGKVKPEADAAAAAAADDTGPRAAPPKPL